MAQVVKEYILEAELHDSKICLAQETKQITWYPPPSNLMRLNLNEAIKNDLIDGYGGLLRGCTSE